jgi:hypothetical protein
MGRFDLIEVITWEGLTVYSNDVLYKIKHSLMKHFRNLISLMIKLSLITDYEFKMAIMTAGLVLS